MACGLGPMSTDAAPSGALRRLCRVPGMGTCNSSSLIGRTLTHPLDKLDGNAAVREQVTSMFVNGVRDLAEGSRWAPESLWRLKGVPHELATALQRSDEAYRDLMLCQWIGATARRNAYYVPMRRQVWAPILTPPAQCSMCGAGSGMPSWKA